MPHKEVIGALQTALGLGAIELNEDGYCQLLFEDRLPIEVELPPDGAVLTFAYQLVNIPEDLDASFLFTLLSANCKGSGTGGFGIGYEPENDRFLFFGRYEPDRINEEYLSAQLEAFLREAEVMEEKLLAYSADMTAVDSRHQTFSENIIRA